MATKEKNLAFIDGQNLHLGTTQNNWKVDHYRFRTYLKDKYQVEEAYYFLGYFEIMRNLLDNDNFHKIVLISGDGDYKKLVEYLVKKNKLKKLLFPNKEFSSSLYKSLGGESFDYLENESIKTKIEFKIKKKAP